MEQGEIEIFPGGRAGVAAGELVSRILGKLSDRESGLQLRAKRGSDRLARRAARKSPQTQCESERKGLLR
jgi:hypothetical protein